MVQSFGFGLETWTKLNNIIDICNKGIGYVNHILSILKEISFGQFHFEQALQFRHAKLINGMLYSIEINTISHIEQLKQWDKFFIRKIFNSVLTTPTEAYYLEKNSIRLRFVIIARRLMYHLPIMYYKTSERISTPSFPNSETFPG